MESVSNKAYKVGSAAPMGLDAAMKHVVPLVLRENGTNNWQEWLESWKVVGPLVFPKDDMFKAITEGVQWVDPKWVILRMRIPDDEEDVRKLIYRDDRDSQVTSSNTQMLNSLILSVDKSSILLKAQSNHSAEYKDAIDNHRPDLMVKIIQKTVLLRHVSDGNNQLAAEERFHSIRTRTREPALHSKLYMEFANVYLDTLSAEAKAAWHADHIEATRYVKTLGAEFHDWLDEYAKAPLDVAGVTETIAASLLWYRKESDKRRFSGMRAPSSKVHERNVAFVADAAKVDSKYVGKLNNGAAGKDGPCDYCLTVLKVEKFHATRNCFAMQNQGKAKMSTAFGTRASDGAKRPGRGGGVPAARGGFRGRGGGRGGRHASFKFSKNGKANFAQSDGLAYRVQVSELGMPYEPMVDVDYDMPELIDDDESSDSDHDHYEIDSMPKLVETSSESDSSESWDADRAAIVNGYDSILQHNVSSENPPRPRVTDSNGVELDYKIHVGPISLYNLKQPYNADAAYVLEGLRDMTAAHSERYMLEQLRYFLEHAGFPRRRSYLPEVQPNFTVDVADDSEDDVGFAFMLKRPMYGDEDYVDTAAYCDSCDCELPEETTFCTLCNHENAVATGCSKKKTAGKRRKSVVEQLQESGMLGASIEDVWTCSYCPTVNPFDYDFCSNCFKKQRPNRTGKPVAKDALRETSKMKNAERYSPPDTKKAKPMIAKVFEVEESSCGSESGNRVDSNSESDTANVLFKISADSIKAATGADKEDQEKRLLEWASNVRAGGEQHALPRRCAQHQKDLGVEVYHQSRFVKEKQRYLVSKSRYDQVDNRRPPTLPLTLVGRDRILESLDALILTISHHANEEGDLDMDFFRTCAKSVDRLKNFLVAYEHRKHVEAGSYSNQGSAFHQVSKVNHEERAWCTDFVHRYNGDYASPFVRNNDDKDCQGSLDVAFCGVNGKFMQRNAPAVNEPRKSIVLNKPLAISHRGYLRHMEDQYADFAVRDIDHDHSKGTIAFKRQSFQLDEPQVAVEGVEPEPGMPVFIEHSEVIYTNLSYSDDEDGSANMVKSNWASAMPNQDASVKRKGYGDSAASHNIGSLKDRDLYTNIRKLKIPKRFNGVGKGSIVCHVIGDRGGVKDIYLSNDIDESLFSFASLWEQNFRGVIDNDLQTLTFQKNSSIIVFKLIDRMLLLTSLDGENESGSAFSTGEVPTSKYSKRQKQRADAYWAWHNGCGHHGDGVESQLLQATPLHHCDVSAQDKVIALEMHGPCAACAAGKANSPKSLPITLQRKYQIGECQYVDIMLVRLSSGQHRIKFVFVDSCCLKAVIVHATSKATSEYASALSKVSGYYKSRGFSVVKVTYSDNEPAIHGNSDNYLRQGGQARFVAAGEHVVIVERCIQTIKKMCRTLLLSLAYPLPERLVNYLLDEVISLMSLRPTEGSNGLPLVVLLEGRWPDYRRLQVAWGNYVFATVPVDRRQHDFAATAEPAILMRRPLCGEPNFTCMLLRNNELVQRRGIKAMLMPDSVIAEFKSTTSVAPTLSFGDSPIRGALLGRETTIPRDVAIGQGMEVTSMLDADEEIRDQVNAQFHASEDVVVDSNGRTIDSFIDLTGPEDHEEATQSVEVKDEFTEDVMEVAPVVAPAVPARIRAPKPPSNIAMSKLKVQQVIREVAQLESGQAKVAYDMSRKEYEAVRIKQRREAKAAGVQSRRQSAVNGEARAFRDMIVGIALVTSDIELKTEPHTSKFSKPAKSGNMSFRAAKGKHDDVADEAGMKEVAQILEKDIFEPVFWNDLPQAMKDKAIRSFTFFKEKFKVTGSLEKLKARLVAGGNLVASEDLGDIASPTAKLETLFLLHSLAAQFGWMLSVMDVPGAYLNTVLPEAERVPMILGKEEVVVALRLKPEWKKYVRADGTMAVMLKGGLYGMPQAAKLWNEMIAKTLLGEGYQQAEADTCLFIKFHPDGKKSIVLLYVDDLAHFHEEKFMQDSLIKALSKQYGDLTAEHGDTGIYIGVEYNYNRADKSVKLTMSKYVNKLLADFNVQKGASTPVAADFMERDESSPRVDSKVFASGVMSLYYLALRVRKDLLFPITVLSTRIQDCCEDDVSKLARLYSYLYSTRELGVILRTRGVNLIYSIDASYATHTNGRSHTGFYVTLGTDGPPPDGFGGPIHCRSVVQKLVTLSSFEAELNAIHQSVQYFYDLRLLMSELGFDQEEPSILLQDNQATILVATQGPSVNSRSRHVNVRIFNVKQMIDWGMLSLVYQPTDDMLADVLTKPFSSRASLGLLTRLLNWY